VGVNLEARLEQEGGETSFVEMCVCCGMSCGERLTRDTLRAESGWPREASSFERRAYTQEGLRVNTSVCVCVCVFEG